MEQNRKNNAEFFHISEVLGRCLKPYHHKSGDGIESISKLWKETVGDVISENTRPVVIKKEQLLVHVTSSSWIQQLMFLQHDIIAKVNKALGKEQIKTIKFKIGSV